LRFWSDEQIDHVHNPALPFQELHDLAGGAVLDGAEMADSEDEARLTVINPVIAQKVASVILCQNEAVFQSRVVKRTRYVERYGMGRIVDICQSDLLARRQVNGAIGGEIESDVFEFPAWLKLDREILGQAKGKRRNDEGRRIDGLRL
jgi:hypothetical protein